MDNIVHLWMFVVCVFEVLRHTDLFYDRVSRVSQKQNS